MAGLSGNPYDWGLDKVANNMASLNESISRDRALKEQENAQKIVNQKNLFEMDRIKKHEELMDKEVNATSWMAAQGAHPDDIKVTEGIWESSGLGTRGPLGELRIKMRNFPDAIKTVQDNPKNQLAIAQSGFKRLQGTYNTLQEENNKLMESDPVNFQENKKYLENQQKMTAIQKQANVRKSQIDEAQMLIDPKLREGMEEKALARQDRKDLQTERLQSQKDIADANRLSTEQRAKQHDETLRALKSMRGGEDSRSIVQSTFVDPKTGSPLVFDKKTESYRIANIEGGGGVTAKPGAPTPEKAAKEQLVTQALSYMPDIKQMILGTDFENKPSVDRSTVLNAETRMPFTKGRQASTLILDAVEAKLRAESGAAVPETEVKRIAKRYIPQVADDDATIIMKLNNMEKFLQGTQDKMQMGKTPQAKGATPKTVKYDANGNRVQ
jgi:hypothetical protein